MYRGSGSSRRYRSSHGREHRARRDSRSYSRRSHQQHHNRRDRYYSSHRRHRRTYSPRLRADSGHYERRGSRRGSIRRYRSRSLSGRDCRHRHSYASYKYNHHSYSRRHKAHYKEPGRRRRHNRSSSRSERKRDRRSEDEIVHFKWEPGMMLGEYKVLQKIADGTFGRVLLCEKEGERFAVKVVRDVEKYTSSAKIEADILNDIQKVDENGESHCVSLRDQFLFKGRIMCLAFECLGDSLYEFLRRNDYKGFFIADIQKVAFQMLKGLAFLKQNRLIHTDLKPENVLLTCGRDDFIEVPFPRSTSGMLTKRPATSDIKIIDFGSTIYDDDYHSRIINTRQYRSPEVILDIGWSYASDMWSLGCILIEMYTGDLLFNTHSHLEHLAMMEQIVGKFPTEMLKRASKSDGRRYLHPDRLELNWPGGARSKSSEERVQLCRNVMDLVKPEHRPFAEFIKYILNPDPDRRPTPEDAMEHEFLVLHLPES